MANKVPVTSESCVGYIDTRVIFPDGSVKPEHKLDVNSVVREEKERLLREKNIPHPTKYLMVLLGPQQSRQVLNDTRSVIDCVPSLAQGDKIEVEICRKGAEAERPPKSIKPDDFAIKMK